tara:strand:- start:560 stop:703 length:144 start_codon:yes stop_codon:yes gene_type:complete
MNWIKQWWTEHQVAKKLYEEALKDFTIISEQYMEMEKNKRNNQLVNK